MKLSKKILTWFWKAPEIDYAKKEPVKKIGEILIDIGAIAPADLDNALRSQEMGSKKRVGLILMDQGALNLSDLVKALKVQRTKNL